MYLYLSCGLTDLLSSARHRSINSLPRLSQPRQSRSSYPTLKDSSRYPLGVNVQAINTSDCIHFYLLVRCPLLTDSVLCLGETVSQRCRPTRLLSRRLGCRSLLLDSSLSRTFSCNTLFFDSSLSFSVNGQFSKNPRVNLR